MELFLDVLAESLVDTAKMLPFLFLAYLFIEYVETRHGERIETLLAHADDIFTEMYTKDSRLSAFKAEKQQKQWSKDHILRRRVFYEEENR